MEGEKYTIGWNTFQKQLRESNRELYNEKHFADVTLVSDDMVQVNAHRAILSSASTFFKQLLLLNSNSLFNQILFLKGIKYEELEAILQFIYLGEANVSENRIDFFVNASTDLDIKELKLEKDEINMHPNAEDEIVAKLETKDIDNANESQTDDYIMHDENIVSNDCPESGATFSKPSDMKKHYKSTHRVENFDAYESQKDDYLKHDINIVSNDCPECGATFSKPSNMRKHYKNIHRGENYGCNQCDKYYTQKDNLDTHIRAVHLGVRFPCNMCDKICNSPSNLSSHMKIHRN